MVVKKHKKFKNIKITNRKNTKKKKKNKLKFLYFSILFIFFIIIIPWIIIWFRFKKNILDELPNISKIENISLSQTSIITDRNWEILYKLFEENRKYVHINEISDNIKNAIIAIEDKNFRTNPWIDIVWIIRAGIFDITHPNAPKQWGSTLTQQLIKNVFLTNEKTIERKLKEISLALKIDNYIKDNINKNYKNLSKKETEKKVKEKILEIYLNYIFFWNNSYWIETASQRYFDKSAEEINIFEASIIASLPKAPSKYSPFKNKDLLMGNLIIKNKDEEKINFSWKIKEQITQKINKNIEKSSFNYYNNSSSLINFLKWLMSFEIEVENKNYNIKYIPWRKDIVLARMYEEKYIDQKKFHKAFVKGLDYNFKKKKINMKAPHFVNYVISSLKDKFDNQTLMKWWLTIKTSLDYNVQKLAEKSIKENLSHIHSKWANNSAMIYLNSKNWNIISYVWSAEFNSWDIDWQVDMVTSLRQPGSSIKPFVYSLWFKKNKFTPDTPIYDIPFKIWEKEPENFDGKFLWLLPIKKALAYSRNIPAIKMFFLAWWENAFENFLISLWMDSINKKRYYWYSMAIGSAEATMLELANAYSHLSALWKPAKINPILEIRDSDGSILYKKEKDQQKQIIPSWIAYIIWDILSNKSNFPPEWRNNYTYKGIDFWTKSGTTNIEKNNKKLPRDWWLATYTPSKVAVFWAGNTNGNAMKSNAFGGWLNSPIRKTFIEKLENRWMIKDQKMSEKWIKKISVSKITGKLSSYTTPLSLTTKTLWYINNLPKEKSENVEEIKIDSLCDGKVSSFTPQNDIEKAYLIKPYSIMPNNKDIKKIKQRWKETWIQKYSKKIGNKVFTEKPQKECEERQIIKEKWKIKLEILKPQIWQEITRNFSLWYNIRSPFNIEKIKISLNNNIELKEYRYKGKKEITSIKNLKIPEFINKWKHNLIIKAFDSKWYQDQKNIAINITNKDKDKPYLLKNKMKIEENNWEYKITLLFRDNTSFVSKWTIKQNWKEIKKFEWNVAVINVTDKKDISYSISDKFWNTKEWQLPLK